MALNRLVPRIEYSEEPEEPTDSRKRKPKSGRLTVPGEKKKIWLPPEDGEDPRPNLRVLNAPEEVREDSDEEPSGGKEESPAEEEVRMLPGVKKASLRRLKTMFGQRSDSIIDLLEMENTDGALSLISKSLLQTLVDVLPVVERNVRKSRGARGVYQLNQLISQIREMCHDVQAYKDKSNLGQRIVENTLRPSYLDLAVQFTHAWTELESGARNRMPKDEFETYARDFLVPLKHNIALYLKQQYEDVSERIIRSLA